MLVFIIRLLFFLMMAAGGYVFGGAYGEGKQLTGMLSFAGVAVLVIVLDVAFRRKGCSWGWWWRCFWAPWSTWPRGFPTP